MRESKWTKVRKVKRCHHYDIYHGNPFFPQSLENLQKDSGIVVMEIKNTGFKFYSYTFSPVPFKGIWIIAQLIPFFSPYITVCKLWRSVFSLSLQIIIFDHYRCKGLRCITQNGLDSNYTERWHASLLFWLFQMRVCTHTIPQPTSNCKILVECYEWLRGKSNNPLIPTVISHNLQLH